MNACPEQCIFIQDVRRFCAFLTLFKNEAQINIGINVHREEIMIKTLMISKSVLFYVHLHPTDVSSHGIILRTSHMRPSPLISSEGATFVFVTVDTMSVLRAFSSIQKSTSTYLKLRPMEDVLIVDAYDKSNTSICVCTIRYVIASDEDDLHVPESVGLVRVVCPAHRLLSGFISTKEDMIIGYYARPGRLQWDLMDTLYSISHTWMASAECTHTSVSSDIVLRYSLLYSSIHLIKQVLSFVEKEDVHVHFGDPETFPLLFECSTHNMSVVVKLFISPKIDDNAEYMHVNTPRKTQRTH
jgi:hypothetical protein